MGNPFAEAAERNHGRSRGRSASIFRGGETGRLMQDWLVGNFETDEEVRMNMRLLRARARDLVKNNPWIAGFVDELANNVIGPDGVLLQAKIMTAARAGVKAQLAHATNKEIERGWREWGMPENCTADGHDSWVELQRLKLQTIATDGEVFTRRIRGFDNPFGYAQQIIDADLVDETFDLATDPVSGNRVRMGIELDRWNRPVAYHIYNRYPFDRSGLERRRERIPASEIEHLFIRYRPNQTRGVTWFAPILTSVRHLEGYELNELVATRAAAAKMGFIINKNPEAIQAFDVNEHHKKRRTMDAEPGLIDELFPGQEFVSFDPTHPNSAYPVFVSTVLRAIARGLRISYLTLTGDLTGANYSSMRAGLLPERDHWRALQVWFGVHSCRLAYRDWIRMTLLQPVPAIKVDSRLASEYFEVIWKGRGWKWVDPKNDLEAAKLELGIGVNSRQRIASERGYDFEEIVEELEYEETFANDHDVDVSGTQGKTPVAPAAQTPPDPLRPDGSGNDAGANARTSRDPSLAVA